MRVSTDFEILSRRLGSAWNEALHDVENEARHNAGVTKHASTKALRRSVRLEIVGRRARIGSPLKYARIRDRGGIIRARRAPYLHFKGSRGWAKVKQVRQIGNTWLTSAANRFPTHFLARLRNQR